MNNFKSYPAPLSWHVAYRSAGAPKVNKTRPFTRLKFALDFADMVVNDGGKAAVYAKYHDRPLLGLADWTTWRKNSMEYMVYKGQRREKCRPVRELVQPARQNVYNVNISDFSVVWSEEDSEFVGLNRMFPSLSWLAKSREAALAGICLVVDEYLGGPED